MLQRERFLHLSWSAYSGAKMLHVTLLALLQTGLSRGLVSGDRDGDTAESPGPRRRSRREAIKK